MCSAMTDKQIRTRLKSLAGIEGSQVALAGKMKVAPSYLSDVINGRRDAGPAILEYLGLTRVTTIKEDA